MKNISGCRRGGANVMWQDVRDILQSTTEDVCGTHRNSPRYRETWWWNDEAGKTVAKKC